jgi:hypothetical protein
MGVKSVTDPAGKGMSRWPDPILRPNRRTKSYPTFFCFSFQGRVFWPWISGVKAGTKRSPLGFLPENNEQTRVLTY